MGCREPVFPENLGEKHLAVINLLDDSGSMRDTRREAQSANAAFIDSIRDDLTASACCELAIFTFNDAVHRDQEFSPASKAAAPALRASGGTAMNRAILDGLDAIEARKAEYRSLGVAYYRPWLVVVTDGRPTDDALKPEALERLNKFLTNKKIVLFLIGVTGADLDELTRYTCGSPFAHVLSAEKEHYADIFEWLSSSIAVSLGSEPGQLETESAPVPDTIKIIL